MLKVIDVEHSEVDQIKTDCAGELQSIIQVSCSKLWDSVKEIPFFDAGSGQM